MLLIENIVKQFKKKNSVVTAIDNVNLKINNGEIICILGHNGAGKTTLMKCIGGLITPTSGSIMLNSKDIIKDKSIPKKSVGAVLEGSRNIYYYLSAKDNLKYFGLLNNLSNEVIKSRTDKYLKLFDLTDRQNDAVKEFSRGMQQKVAIMVALMKDPDILLLDEPTLGLDIPSSNVVKNIIEELAINSKKTIIITTHDISLIEGLNSRVVFMKKGKIIKDDKLENLKNFIQEDNSYEIVLKSDDIKKITNNNKCEVINIEDNIATVKTKDLSWLSESLNKNEVISINKVKTEFDFIYNEIVGDVNNDK
ncbi:ABC-2 type transport system ATP-binding protein [Clostridium collagenovorans DSM 3089]|uniref:ABC-2 type transport system ATP-binding protein n=1 Tax=Clostridium collagenovorans DSM 3089 TaxID=1121306 RepID=A0A1M5X5X5_9CLOT|nr:ABC transporter ATP-binding protein [Clostridium collagenovorans]SHH95225.1 ABC-2 type transport system ATP-binding protein [Clostridium collagenovorans DSM 3089]